MLSLDNLDQISIIIMYALEPHSRLLFGISEIEGKGHTLLNKNLMSLTYIHVSEQLDYRKTKQKQHFNSSMPALRDANNIESVCT